MRAGCTSIEICSDRYQGGVTPSFGLVQEVVKRYKHQVDIHVLIRPRPGDFAYSNDEFEVILRDIISFKGLEVDGVVVGLLLPNGEIDIIRMQVIRKLTSGIRLTFHRAFDVCGEG